MKNDVDCVQLDPQFKYDIANITGGESLFNCFSCGKCSAVCPISEVNEEFKPRKIIHMILLGMKEEVLRNEFIWLCATCDACSFRCPQEVRMGDIMSVVRKIAEEEGYVPSGLNRQMEAIKTFSKVHEINAKYTLWGKIKKNMSKNDGNLSAKRSFNYLDDFDLCINMSLDFIEKYPKSPLLSDVLDFLNKRLILYFFSTEDNSKINEKDRFFGLLLKYSNSIEKISSPLIESLVIKYLKNILKVYEMMGEKKNSKNLLLKIKKRLSDNQLSKNGIKSD